MCGHTRHGILWNTNKYWLLLVVPAITTGGLQATPHGDDELSRRPVDIAGAIIADLAALLPIILTPTSGLRSDPPSFLILPIGHIYALWKVKDLPASNESALIQTRYELRTNLNSDIHVLENLPRQMTNMYKTLAGISNASTCSLWLALGASEAATTYAPASRVGRNCTHDRVF